MSPKATLAMVTLAGLVSGVVGSLGGRMLVADSEEPKKSKAQASSPTERPLLTQQQDERLRAIENRLGGMLRDKRNPTQVEAVPGVTESPEQQRARQDALQELAAAANLSPEEGYQRAMDRWQIELDTFEGEAPDPAWAPDASRSFAQDLAVDAKERGFEVKSTECRTTTCAAKLQFKTHAEAVDRYAELLHRAYTINCAKSATLPNPAPGDEEKPYEVTVLYDCTSARADG